MAAAISNERGKTKEYYGMVPLKIDESDVRHLTYDYSTGWGGALSLHVSK